MRLGKVCGVSLVCNYWFLAVVAIFCFAGLAYSVAVVFVSVLLHELAHAIVARKLGYQVSEIELLPFGGVAKIERLVDRKQQSLLLIAIAGPIFSLSIAALGFLLHQQLLQPQLILIFEVNLMLGLFNLLPAFPLDGGQIARIIFTFFMEYKYATKCVVYLSYGICLCLFGKMIYDYMYVHLVNASLGIIAVFVYCTAARELKGSEFHAMRVMAYKKADLVKEGWMRVQQYSVLKNMPLKDMVHRFEAERYAIIVVLDEAQHICGTFSELELWDALARKGASARFDDLV